jgi:flagellar hook-associated protein 1 FlgK
MADISQIGISSLAAFRAALNVSADNIANANTPGYSRRMIDFTENRFGYGVDVAAVRRVVDEQAK